MPNLLIKNGTIVDGNGKNSFVGDILVTDDKITEIGNITTPVGNGTKTIDAFGKIVSPGIIDIHSHADLSLHKADHPQILKSLIGQGITTFVGGNCGMALAPIGNKHREQIKDYIEAFTRMDFDKDIQWNTMGEYFDFLEKQGVLLNTAILAPHGVMRLSAMGLEMKYADSQDIKYMKKSLEDSMEAGASGLSTGLQYFPGSQSDTTELIELAKVLKKYDGIFTSHLRSYSRTLELAVKEIIGIASAANISAQISHIFWIPDVGILTAPVRKLTQWAANLSKRFTIPLPVDGMVKRQLDLLEKARAEGVQVGIDVMPTTTGFTHLLAFFPPWVLTGNKEAILERLKDKEARHRMLHDIEKGKTIWPHIEGASWSLNLFKMMGWECARIMAVVSEKNKKYEGRNLTSIARELKKHPLDVACDLLLEEDGKVLVFESVAEPDDNFTEQSTFASIKSHDVAISTDTILMGFGKPSSLFYACYPKFIGRYVREKKMLSLETAIKKITSLPAASAGIKNRGLLEKNFFADILIFDFNKIASQSTFYEPEKEPLGIEYVIVNGGIVFEKGKFFLSPLRGKVLRKQQ